MKGNLGMYLMFNFRNFQRMEHYTFQPYIQIQWNLNNNLEKMFRNTLGCNKNFCKQHSWSALGLLLRVTGLLRFIGISSTPPLVGWILQPWENKGHNLISVFSYFFTKFGHEHEHKSQHFCLEARCAFIEGIRLLESTAFFVICFSVSPTFFSMSFGVKGWNGEGF